MKSGLSISRRDLIGAFAALPFWASPALAATRASRIMVQGHPSNSQSPYKLANIVPALDLLGGVRKMRCREPYGGTPGWKTYVGLARAGVRFCFTLSGKRPIARTLTDLKKFQSLVPGAFFAVEYPNEPDLNPVAYKGLADPRMGFRSGHAPALMEYIKDFERAFRRERAFQAVALVASNDFMQAEQGPYCNYGNTHIYPSPSANVNNRLKGFGDKIAAGGHTQGFVTEWGRTTGGDKRNRTSPPITLQKQADLLASDVAAALSKPYIHTFTIYELFCWTGGSEIANFGLFNRDLSPRPAVAAIRSVIV